MTKTLVLKDSAARTIKQLNRRSQIGLSHLHFFIFDYLKEPEEKAMPDVTPWERRLRQGD